METILIIFVLLFVMFTGISNGMSGLKWSARDHENALKTENRIKGSETDLTKARKSISEAEANLYNVRKQAAVESIGSLADMTEHIHNAENLEKISVDIIIPEEKLTENSIQFPSGRKTDMNVSIAAAVSVALGLVFAYMICNIINGLMASGALLNTESSLFRALGDLLQGETVGAGIRTLVYVMTIAAPSVFLAGTVFSVAAHRQTDRVEKLGKDADRTEADVKEETDRINGALEVISETETFTEALAAAQDLLNSDMKGIFDEEYAADWVALDTTQRKKVFAAFGCAAVLSRFISVPALDERGELSDEMESMMKDLEIRELALSGMGELKKSEEAE